MHRHYYFSPSPKTVQLLANARARRTDSDIAERRTPYDHIAFRVKLVNACRLATQITPRAWQLDVAEALYLNVDGAVVAGTGYGKTLPFVLSNLLDRTSITVIVSPLDALETNQVRSLALDQHAYIH